MFCVSKSPAGPFRRAPNLTGGLEGHHKPKTSLEACRATISQNLFWACRSKLNLLSFPKAQQVALALALTAQQLVQKSPCNRPLTHLSPAKFSVQVQVQGLSSYFQHGGKEQGRSCCSCCCCSEEPGLQGKAQVSPCDSAAGAKARTAAGAKGSTSSWPSAGAGAAERPPPWGPGPAVGQASSSSRP